MAKVLFVNFPPQGLDLPPIGIASLFANIKDISEGDIFDFNINLFHENFFPKNRWDFSEHKFWEVEETATKLHCSKTYSHFVKILKRGNYDIICFTINTHGWGLLDLTLNHLFDKLKLKHKLIIVGGPFCSKQEICRLSKNRYINLFVVGEGESLLKNITNLYLAKGTINRLKNVQITPAGNRFLIADKITNLDSLKNPDYSLLNLSLYKSKGFLPIYFSRGCNSHCSFCRDKPIWGKNVWRNPKCIAEEMAHLVKEYNIKGFCNVDLDVLSDLNKLNELCLLVIEKKLNTTWGAQARVNKLVTLKLLETMRRAGCGSLCLGLESGSSRVCKDMGKESPKEVERFIRKAYDAKIDISLALIVGYPTETWFDFSKTVFFILKNFRYITRIVTINTFYILYNSIMFSRLDDYGIRRLVNGDWETDKNNAKIREIRYKILNFIVNKTFRSNRYC